MHSYVRTFIFSYTHIPVHCDIYTSLVRRRHCRCRCVVSVIFLLLLVVVVVVVFVVVIVVVVVFLVVDVVVVVFVIGFRRCRRCHRLCKRKLKNRPEACRKQEKVQEEADKEREKRIRKALSSRDAWRFTCRVPIYKEGCPLFPVFLSNGGGEARTKALLKMNSPFWIRVLVDDY